jgi:hypothetical protein
MHDIPEDVIREAYMKSDHHALLAIGARSDRAMALLDTSNVHEWLPEHIRDVVAFAYYEVSVASFLETENVFAYLHAAALQGIHYHHGRWQADRWYYLGD